MPQDHGLIAVGFSIVYIALVIIQLLVLQPGVSVEEMLQCQSHTHSTGLLTLSQLSGLHICTHDAMCLYR